MSKRMSNKKVKQMMVDVFVNAGKHKTKIITNDNGGGMFTNPSYRYECSCGHISREVVANIYSPTYCYKQVATWSMSHRFISKGVVSLTADQLRGVK